MIGSARTVGMTNKISTRQVKDEKKEHEDGEEVEGEKEPSDRSASRALGVLILV